MAINVKANAQRIYEEWSKALLSARAAAPAPIWPGYCVEVPSKGRFTTHAWFLDQAKPRLWVGKRQYNNLSTATWQVWNKDYELSYEFEAREIDDDLDGLVANAVTSARNVGAKWMKHEDLIVAQALEAGNTSLCWDGQNFFDDAHPYDIDGIGTAATFDNDLTLALNHTNLDTALQVFESMVGVDGMPIVSDGPIYLEVPVALGLTAMQVTADGVISTAATRALFSQNAPAPNLQIRPVIPRVNKYLNLDGANATTWYLTRADGIVKPLMFQRRQGVETYEQGRDSQIYFDEKKIRFGSDARHQVSYTLPQLALRSKP